MSSKFLRALLAQSGLTIHDEIPTDLVAQANWAEEQGVRVCFREDPDYPRALLNGSSSPQVLWFFGEPVWNERCSLAIVGSRHPSRESLQWLNWHGGEFIRSHPSVCIVSGGARGVDYAAHMLAVRRGVPTVVLMPTGLRYRYPPEFGRIEPAILDGGGALVSPFLPNWPLHKANFARRNQVIAGMASATLLIEARRRSGTMLTARAAAKLEQEIGVMPTSPMNAAGMGGLDMICDGSALLIRDAQDLTVLWARALSRTGRASHSPDGESTKNHIHEPDRYGSGEGAVASESFAGEVKHPVADDDEQT